MSTVNKMNKNNRIRQKKKLVKLILVLVFCFFGIAENSNAQKIRLVTENYPPFQIEEPGKPLSGFAIELVEAIKRYAGINVKTEVYPWARAYKIALKYPNTFIFSIAKTKEREHLFKWVGEYFKATTSIYALKSRSDIIINSLENAKKFKIGTPRSDAGALFLESKGFNAEHLHYLVNQDQAITMLYLGRVDLNVNNNIGFMDALKRKNYDPQKFKNVFVISAMPLGIAANKNTPDILVQKIQTALEKVNSDGTYQKLMGKWFPGKI